MYSFASQWMHVVEGISLRACCSDGGVCNVGVGGGWLFSKDVGMFITDNTGMGLYFEEVDGRWWLADLLFTQSAANAYFGHVRAVITLLLNLPANAHFGHIKTPPSNPLLLAKPPSWPMGAWAPSVLLPTTLHTGLPRPTQGTSRAETQHRLLTNFFTGADEFWDPGVPCEKF